MICDLITKKLPETVAVDGIEYPIRTDYRVGIQFDTLLKSGKSEAEKLGGMLQLYYPKCPDNLQEAVSRLLWFYQCGETGKEEEERRYRKKPKGPAYAFSQDSAYVYAAFREQYDIDLTQLEYMHWWKFIALFESLGEDTKMGRIMYYRIVSTSGMPKDKRAFINEMKKLYEIKDTAPGKKMSLEERNNKWREYVKERHKGGVING